MPKCEWQTTRIKNISGCKQDAKWVIIWGCFQCDSYMEKYLCFNHAEQFVQGNNLDACAKCKTSTAEYLAWDL